MTADLIVLTALRPELDQQKLPEGIQVFYTGIGKINATIATFKAIEQTRPALIVNFGTVGTVCAEASGLIEIARVVQRDMLAEPLSPEAACRSVSGPMSTFQGVAHIRAERAIALSRVKTVGLKLKAFMWSTWSSMQLLQSHMSTAFLGSLTNT